MSNGNPFYVHPGTDFGPGLMGLAKTVERVGERKRIEQKEQDEIDRIEQKEQKEKDRIDAMKKGAAEVYKSKDPNKMAEFALQNPEISELLMKTIGHRNEQTKENYIDSIFQAIQDPSKIPDIAANRQAFLRSQGVGPEESKETDSIVERYNQDPEGTLQSLKSELAFLAPDKWKAYKDAQSPPGEATKVEEFKYYQTLLRESPEQAKQFATQAGITKDPADSRTMAIKEFEYGEKNPKFALQQKAKEDAKNTKAVKDTEFKDAQSLRKEFLQQSKEYQKVRDSYTRVIGSTREPSPAGDLSLIFNYMKMLDPGSVVRESEFATAAATGSYGQRIQASVQRVLSGERLAPEMRKDFVEKASVLLDGMRNQHFKRERNYTDIAIKSSLPVDEVVVDINAPEFNEEEEDTLPTDMPDPTKHTGRTIKDTESEKHYKSNGTEWIEVK